ncbi:MAG: hypothetical protein NVS4B11_06120 [Ktedonobacteraceae bacterium]
MVLALTLVWKKQRYRSKYHVGGDPATRIFPALYALLFLSLCLSGCSGFNLGASPTPTTKAVAVTVASAAPQVTLADLHWCGKQVLVFRDEGSNKVGTATASGTPAASTTPTGTVTPTVSSKTITDWKQVEPSLGFTVFLPATLPQGSCLVSASGTIHDPTFGGIFTIGYVLPNHDALSLSEAPLASQSSTFQCSPSSSETGSKNGTPTPGPTVDLVQLCTGVRNMTNIVLSAHGTSTSLQQLFNALQPHVAWVPVS